ncbi:uncharacterized protein At1g76070-like [Pyrus x bretschneideri]|uniref:uncharacterized protein At1g76070-like n=1 Tax=Pyrus x bretschneideri TaxID=225117 RepID=UPI000510D993|nr:uncharacterized protein At1g76070-like [Pyrus x bretschneideri]
MEKPLKRMGSKILTFLSKAAQPAVITFHSPPPSPRKAAGPMIRIFPPESRRKTRSGITFASKEPTSPKVSCMGQVHGKKKSKSKSNSTGSAPVSCIPKEVKNKPARVSSKVPKEVALPEEGNENRNRDGAPERVPSLGQMKRFASGRSTLAD